MLENLRKQDPEIINAMELELKRQRDNIELIASENILAKRSWTQWDPC